MSSLSLAHPGSQNCPLLPAALTARALSSGLCTHAGDPLDQRDCLEDIVFEEVTGSSDGP